jgi:uncharacterized membrane-anchored protein YhcB (DUF1043 family)
MKLRNQSIIIVGLVIVASFILVAYFLGEKMSQSSRKISLDLSIAKARNSYLIVQKELEKRQKEAELTGAALSEVLRVNDVDKKLLEYLLQTYLNENNQINGTWLFQYNSLGNNIWCKKEGEEVRITKTNIRIQSLVKEFKRYKSVKLIVPYKNSKGKLMLSFMTPLYVGKHLIGVYGVDVDLLRFQQMFYDDPLLGSVYVTIISRSGICISHPDENLLGKKIDTLKDANYIKEAFQTGKTSQNEVYSNFLNMNVMRLYQPISLGEANQRWLITVSIPLFSVRETVRETRKSVFLIGVLLAILLMIFLYFSQIKWSYESSLRRKAEDKHRDLLLKLSAIMENSDQVMIFSLDQQYCYTSYNTAHKKDFLKYEGVEVNTEKSYLDAYSGDFRIRMKKYLDRALSGEHFIVEYQRNGVYYQQIFNAISNQEKEIVGLSSIRFNISENVELRKRAIAQEEEKVQAQLKNLKNQINPHFLFNSLNSLYALVEEEPELSRKFIVKLSKVYRYLLDSSNSNLIELSQEIDFIKHYLFLQKIRFGENIQLHLTIEEHLLRRQLPSVSLQSLIENAIKHNIITSDKKLIIDIKNEGDDYLVVKNNYQPRTDDVEPSGTGLKNLKALYRFLGNKKVEYGVKEDCFCVKIPIL